MLRHHLPRAFLAAGVTVSIGWAAVPAAAEEPTPTPGLEAAATEGPLLVVPTELPQGEAPLPAVQDPPPPPPPPVPVIGPVDDDRVVPTAPGPPSIQSVVAGQGAARVDWKRPADNGGDDIRGYVVRAEPSGAVVRTGPNARSVRVDRLRNGQATTFTVAAVNTVGTGRRSRESAPVIPRRVARFVIKRNAQRRVVYGTASTVRTRLETIGGVGVSGQRVQLLARFSRTSGWRDVTAATTNAHGIAVLHARLPASASLRLRHPIGAVVAQDRDARPVVVAKRVTATASRTRIRQGMRIVVRGRVAPDQKQGSRVRLQRRVGDSWKAVSSGRMKTRERYAITWRPQQAGRYTMRVKKDGDSARAAGVSRRWTQRVDAESAADIASDILHDKGITLATVHVSGGGDGATAKANMIDVAHGRYAQRSCYSGAPCGSTAMDLRVLRAVRAMGARGTITVSEFAGGVHAGSSAHYSGDGVDINWVNGRHVSWGSGYDMAVSMCRAYGAKQVLYPANDPWGGHHNHVHCGW